MKKPLNFPNAKDTDDFKDIYNPNKGPNPGAYSQKKSDPKVVPVEPVVADKKAEVKKIAEPTKATPATPAKPAPTPLDKSKAPRANIPE